MSKNIWQIRKQAEQYGTGESVTARIAGYVRTWEARAYSEGIPDSVPDGLLNSGRVPSWKAVAMCILRNDLQLRGLGFHGKITPWAKALADEAERNESDQLRLL